MVRRLHLIRHAPAVVDSETENDNWQLTARGRRETIELVDKLRHLTLSRVYSSNQRRAQDTAKIIATNLKLSLHLVDGLEEHHRTKEDFINSDKEFEESLAVFFLAPNELVFGQETASQALLRFSRALDWIMGAGTGDELVVSHGTVISLWLAKKLNYDPMQVWRSLVHPDLITVEWP